MKKINRNTIQVGFLILGFFLIILTYLVYPILMVKTVEEKIETKIEEKIEDETSFTNVEYKGITNDGSPYIVRSELANVDRENQDLIYMTNITAKYYYEEGKTVTITSNEGLFNKSTGDINFKKNVKMVDELENMLTAENLDMVTSKDYIEAFNNVKVLTNDGQTVVADQVKVDAVEKILKVSMFGNEKKIKIKLTE